MTQKIRIIICYLFLCLQFLSFMSTRYLLGIKKNLQQDEGENAKPFFASEIHSLFFLTNAIRHGENPEQQSACGDYCSMATENGTWRSKHGKSFIKKSTVASSGSEWCPKRCLLADFDGISPSATSNRALLQGVKLVLVGNSHMRNLFRCLGERLTEGASARDRKTCPGSACLSCHSFMAMHGRDLNFSVSNISTEFYWAVIWDLPTKIRTQCNLTRSLVPVGEGATPANISGTLEADTVRQCVAAAHRLRKSYIGSRIGLDFLRTKVGASSLPESVPSGTIRHETS